MSDDIKTIERLTAVETDIKHMTAAIEKMAARVVIVHDTVTQAKGGYAAVLGVSALAGAVAGFIAKWAPFASSVGPR